jgi:hypothetical protein
VLPEIASGECNIAPLCMLLTWLIFLSFCIVFFYSYNTVIFKCSVLLEIIIELSFLLNHTCPRYRVYIDFTVRTDEVLNFILVSLHSRKGFCERILRK